MVIPKSMAITATALALGFLLAMIGAIRANSNKLKYQRIRNVSTSVRNGIPPITSYQDASAAVQYSLPQNHKSDITYCVIDGRLVDDK
jgi:dsRNA-specific ribonuclease